MQRFLHRLIGGFQIAASQRGARQIQLMLKRFLKTSGRDRREEEEKKETTTETKDGRNLSSAV
ncbi:MAG: hypothetical protein Q8N04_04805 [Nitrospira sp.]|nr:hypothetical protein [Nitrospira sp.]MDP3089973.1 hypothetical protein [Nitrospira sp.]